MDTDDSGSDADSDSDAGYNTAMSEGSESEVEQFDDFIRGASFIDGPTAVAPADTDWPTIPSAHPDPSADLPLPHSRPPPAERAACWGVSNSAQAEFPEVAIHQHLPVSNIPVATAVQAVPAIYCAKAGVLVPARADWPRDGHPEDLFQLFNFCPCKHGRWVRHRMRQLGLRGRLWALSPEQIVSEQTLWVASNARDLREAERRINRPAGGPSLPPWRPVTLEWIIPPEAVVSSLRYIIWDLRFHWQKVRDGTGRGQIVPLRRSLCDASAKCSCCFVPRRPPEWQVDRMAEWCQRSGMPDLRRMQQMQGQGLEFDFEGEWSTVLVPNARNYFEELEFALELAEKEAADGFTEGPWPLGTPFSPCKMHKRGIALAIRDGKVKPRGVGNLTAPQEDALRIHSVNAGRDMDNAEDLTFVTSALIAFAAGLYSLAGGGLELRKCDWSQYYRQLLRHPMGWWLAVCMLSAAGMRVDERIIMGDASSCLTANQVEDILIWLVRWLVLTKVWGWTDEQYADPQIWFTLLLQRPWAVGSVRAWMKTRAAALGVPQAGLPMATNHDRLWNLIPGGLSGYFDDGMIIGIPAIVEDITDALFFLILKVEIGASWAKFERALPDGTTSVLAYSPDSTDHFHRATRVWRDSKPGFLPVLGKEFDLASLTRRDSEKRLADLFSLMQAAGELATASPKRIIPVLLIQKILGILIFVTETTPALRGFLNYTTRCLKIKNGLRPGRTGRNRKVALLECKAKGVSPRPSMYKWQEFGAGDNTVLSRHAVAEWGALRRALPMANGVHFTPRRCPIGTYRDVVFIMNDSAGYEGGTDVTSVRAAACWMLVRSAVPSATAVVLIAWIQEAWTLAVLEATHSTQQEFANGTANLAYAAAKWPACDIVEIFDSQATVALCRTLASRSTDMEDLMAERAGVVLSPSDRRIVQFWTERALGQISDDISKDAMLDAIRRIREHLPAATFEAVARQRPPNLLMAAADSLS